MTDLRKTMIQSAASGRGAARRPGKGKRRGLQRWLLLAASLLLGGWVIWALLSALNGTLQSDANQLGQFAPGESPVEWLAVSLDGATAATADEENSVHFWSPESRRACGDLQPASKSPHCFALSGDGKLLAMGAENGISLWDVGQQKVVRELMGIEHRVSSLAFYPAATHLLAGEVGGGLALWDVEARKVVRRYVSSKSTADVTTLNFLPDGLHFLAGDAKGGLRLWHVNDERELAHCQAHAGPVRSLALAAVAGKAATCGDDGEVRLWDSQDLAPLRTLQCPDRPFEPLAVALSLGGTRLATADHQAKLRLWSCDDGTLLETFSGYAGPVTCCAFFPNGLVAMGGSRDHSVRLWRLPDPSELEQKHMAEVHRDQEQLGQRWREYIGKVKLGRLASQDKKSAEALAEFRAAENIRPADSLETAFAQQQVQTVLSVQAKEKKYRDLCQSAQTAADKENFADAIRQLEQARALEETLQISPEESVARQGIQRATRALKLQRALQTEPGPGTLDFADPLADSVRISDHPQVAFLLPDEQKIAENSPAPPMADLRSALKWAQKIELPDPFPDEPVKLRVTISRDADSQTIAQQELPFITGEQIQSFAGQADPPPGGWQTGWYTLRSRLITRKEVIDKGQPQKFGIGVLRWKTTSLSVTPQSVHASDFAVDSGVLVKKGDAFAISATGLVTPAPLGFYRELFERPDLANEVPSKPVGLPWSNNDQRVRKYRLVEARANFAALLFRIDRETWIPYADNSIPLPVQQSGEIQVSINSILPIRSGGATAQQAPEDSRLQYWRRDSGKFDVTFHHGKFEFPINLKLLGRGVILSHFSN